MESKELCERMLLLAYSSPNLKDRKAREIKEILELFFDKKTIEDAIASLCGYKQKEKNERN